MTNAEFNELFRKQTEHFAVRSLKFLSELPFNVAQKSCLTSLENLQHL